MRKLVGRLVSVHRLFLFCSDEYRFITFSDIWARTEIVPRDRNLTTLHRLLITVSIYEFLQSLRVSKSLKKVTSSVICICTIIAVGPLTHAVHCVELA